MLIRNELPQRARNKQLQLIPLPVPEHTAPPPSRIIEDNGIRRRGLFQRPHDAPLPGSLRKELCGALGKPNAGIRGDQPDTLQPAFLEMLEELAPATLVLL